MHYKQCLYELREGAIIEYTGQPVGSKAVVTQVSRPGRYLKVKVDNKYTLCVEYYRYLHTIGIRSPCCQKLMNNMQHHRDLVEKTIMAVEKYYGIDHHGDETPDAIRQVAFAILRDDPMARDIANDVIRG